MSAKINRNYVLILFTWEKGSLFWQQALVWTHDDYEHNMELHIPERVADIEMLSGHWAALKAIPERAYNKYALHLYDLNNPESVYILSPIPHHVYHDHFNPNVEEFTFYAVTIDGTKHQRIFTRYHIDENYRLSAVEKRVEDIETDVKSNYTWKSVPLSDDAFAVVGTRAGAHCSLYTYNNDPPLSLKSGIGSYHAFSKRGALIFVKRDQLGLCDLTTLRPQHFVPVAPEDSFRTTIMGQFCIFEHMHGVFIIADAHDPMPDAHKIISLAEHLPYDVEPSISEVGISFISGTQLHIYNVCGLF
jgi:hypothetical protein